MSELLTEVTNESWFSRLRAAAGGLIFGLVLFIGAFPALTWNEKRSIDRTRALKDVSAVTTGVDAQTLDPAAEGKAVHFSALATTADGVKDETFGLAEPALKLRRVVEMYQWQQETESKTEEKLGGSTQTTTTYSYRKAWDDQAIDSAQFREPAGHENPAQMMFSSMDVVAAKITAGAYLLPERVVSGIGGWEDLPAPAPESLPEPLRAKAKAAGQDLYFGDNPQAPAVGDHRVRFAVVRPHEISVVARQAGNTLEPVLTKSGAEVVLIEDGVHSPEAMFLMAHDQNKFLTWILRLLFAVLMAVGLSLLFRPLKVLADVVPFVGSLVGAGTGLVSLLLAASLSSATIALAWLAFRPLIGVPLLALTVALLVVLSNRVRAAQKA